MNKKQKSYRPRVRIRDNSESKNIQKNVIKKTT